MQTSPTHTVTIIAGKAGIGKTTEALRITKKRNAVQIDCTGIDKRPFPFSQVDMNTEVIILEGASDRFIISPMFRALASTSSIKIEKKGEPAFVRIMPDMVVTVQCSYKSLPKPVIRSTRYKVINMDAATIAEAALTDRPE